MSDVTDLLDRMEAGEIAVDEVAADFRERVWPRRTRTVTDDATGLYRLDLDDPQPDPEGSFAEVCSYHASRRLDASTYAILAAAAAEAMRDAPAPTPGTPAATTDEGNAR